MRVVGMNQWIAESILRVRLVLGNALRNSGMPGRTAVARVLNSLLNKLAYVAGSVSGNLSLLAILCNTDKYGGHSYTPIYQRLFSSRRWQPITLLEIGVGGYDEVIGGNSLRMWAAYFPRGRICAIDLYDKTALSRGRIRVAQCSQVDERNLSRLANEWGPFDIIIDDGSHWNAHQIKSFEILFHHVKDGGVYVIEDVQTSYWPSDGGGAPGTGEYERSCAKYFKSLVDSVNTAEFLETPATLATLRVDIGSIAFHHNLIVLIRELSP